MPAMFSPSHTSRTRSQRPERQANQPGPLKQLGRSLAKLGQGSGGEPTRQQGAKPARMARDVQAGAASGASRQAERRTRDGAPDGDSEDGSDRVPDGAPDTLPDAATRSNS